MKTKRNLIEIWLLCAAVLQAVIHEAKPVANLPKARQKRVWFEITLIGLSAANKGGLTGF